MKIGLEGFALVDEFYGRNKKPGESRVPTTTTTTTKANYHYHHDLQYYNYNNQRQCVYGGSQVMIVREPVIDSNQTALIYGGISIVDYSIGKPIRRVY